MNQKPWWRNRQKWWREEVVLRYGITEQELALLANYNAERYRGVQHTIAWQAQMTSLQRQTDAHVGQRTQQ